MSRRRAGAVLPLELKILEAGIDLRARNVPMYGFSLARELGEAHSTRGLTSHGTLYKALGRMTDGGLLEASWESPELAAAESRPRRRFYTVTAQGVEALLANRSAVKGDRLAETRILGPAFS